MEVQAIEKAIDIASQIEDKEWLCCLYGYLGDMYIRKYNMLKFIKYQTLANQCIEDIAFRDMDISTQVQMAKSFLYIGNHKKAYELLNLIEISIDKTIFIIMKSNAYKVLRYIRLNNGHYVLINYRKL